MILNNDVIAFVRGRAPTVLPCHTVVYAVLLSYVGCDHACFIDWDPERASISGPQLFRQCLMRFNSYFIRVLAVDKLIT